MSRVLITFALVSISACSCTIDRAIDARPVNTDAGDASDASDAADASPAVSCLLTDTDVGVRVYDISRFGLTQSNAIGLNVDDLDTTSTSDVPGCHRVDADGGVENALAGAIYGLTDLFEEAGIDMPLAFASVVPARQTMTLRLDQWNGTKSDACVRFEVRTDLGNTAIVAEGSLIAGVANALVFEGRFRVSPLVTRIDCDAGACEPIAMTFELEAARGRLVFAGGDDGMAELVAPLPPDQRNANTSLLGGAVTYEDSSDPLAFSIPVGTLAESLQADFGEAIHAVILQFVDLDTSPVLRPCVALDEETSSADSLSAAFILAGAARP